MAPDQQPVERAFFRESEDGTTVFFPWGLNRRGYRLPSEEAKKTASRAASLLVNSAIAIGTWIAYALQPILDSDGAGGPDTRDALLAPGSALLLVFAAYCLWASRFVERFPESDLRVSREERLREAAARVSPRKLALIGVVVCGLSGLAVWLQPRTWWLGLLGVALGVGALVWSSLLGRAADASA